MTEKTVFEQIIESIETYSKQNHLDHRFVGGVSFGGLLNEKTTAEIAIPEKTITLHNHNHETLLRKDKTIRDIDLIFFSPDKKKIQQFGAFIHKLQQQDTYKHTFPDISYEPTIYPSFGKRNPLSQFVTALEVDEKNNLYLAFDDTRQQISWDSIEAWQVVLENGLHFSVRNPIADYYAYIFRSPGGPKPKDEKKLYHLKKLVEQMIHEGQRQTPQIQYLSEAYYGTWQHYIESLGKTVNPVTNTKKFWLKMYWQTIGTPLAHNLTRYGNNFTGIKQ